MGLGGLQSQNNPVNMFDSQTEDSNFRRTLSGVPDLILGREAGLKHPSPPFLSMEISEQVQASQHSKGEKEI